MGRGKFFVTDKIDRPIPSGYGDKRLKLNPNFLQFNRKSCSKFADLYLNVLVFL